jgi:hypothetical protein
MNFTKEQFVVLSQWEGTFRVVCESHYLRGVGQTALLVMTDIWNAARGESRTVNGNCANCVYDFLQDIGKMYLADKRAREAVKTAQTATSKGGKAKVPANGLKQAKSEGV